MTANAFLRSAQSTLDERGSIAGCTALDTRHCLVVARPDAVSVYTRDARGPVFVFPGVRWYPCREAFVLAQGDTRGCALLDEVIRGMHRILHTNSKASQWVTDSSCQQNSVASKDTRRLQTDAANCV